MFKKMCVFEDTIYVYKFKICFSCTESRVPELACVWIFRLLGDFRESRFHRAEISSAMAPVSPEHFITHGAMSLLTHADGLETSDKFAHVGRQKIRADRQAWALDTFRTHIAWLMFMVLQKGLPVTTSILSLADDMKFTPCEGASAASARSGCHSPGIALRSFAIVQVKKWGFG